MRFILNFIFFGVLFYAIYLIFPDAFHTLVGWANSIYELVRDILMRLIEQVQEWRGGVKPEHSHPEHSHPEQALFLIPFWMMMIQKRQS